MKRIVGAIILSVMAVPIMFYVSQILLEIEGIHGGRIHESLCVFAAVAAGCLYWLWVWRQLVRWTRFRVRLTWLLVLFATVIALCVVFSLASLKDHAATNMGIEIGSICFAAIFFLGSMPVWFSRLSDRTARLDANTISPELTELVQCPNCRTDLSQCEILLCPSCESRYTIEQLLELNAPGNGESDNHSQYTPAKPQSKTANDDTAGE